MRSVQLGLHVVTDRTVRDRGEHSRQRPRCSQPGRESTVGTSTPLRARRGHDLPVIHPVLDVGTRCAGRTIAMTAASVTPAAISTVEGRTVRSIMIGIGLCAP